MKVSVIIPVLGFEPGLEAAIGSVFTGLDATSRKEVEVIVAYGGGATEDISVVAARMGATVVDASSAKGRGEQMDKAASIARGDVLLFLHADTTLPPGYLSAVSSALTGDGVAGGGFTLAIDSALLRYRVIEWGVRLRSRFLGLMYGDQALFVRRAAFTELGGFGGLPLMEDVALLRRLRTKGRVVCLIAKVRSSPRRWARRGLVRTTLGNWTCLVLYYMGVAPRTLYRWYYGVRPREFKQGE